MAKYEVKKKYLIIYLCIFVVCFLLLMCRWISAIYPNILLLPSFILFHITNFSLSLMVMLTFGFTVLVFGGEMKIIKIAGLLVAVINISYEVILPILNTPDIVDALFGLFGVALSYIYLVRLKANGLIMKHQQSKTNLNCLTQHNNRIPKIKPSAFRTTQKADGLFCPPKSKNRVSRSGRTHRF